LKENEGKVGRMFQKCHKTKNEERRREKEKREEEERSKNELITTWLL